VAKVEILRKDECSRCKVCGFGSRDRIVAVATNTIGAKEHDEVELELEGSQVVRAAAILYLIPLAFSWPASTSELYLHLSSIGGTWHRWLQRFWVSDYWGFHTQE